MCSGHFSGLEAKAAEINQVFDLCTALPGHFSGCYMECSSLLIAKDTYSKGSHMKANTFSLSQHDIIKSQTLFTRRPLVYNLDLLFYFPGEG